MGGYATSARIPYTWSKAVKILALDFETHYATDYSLSKMTTDAYVHDPRFKVHMMSLRDLSGVTRCYPPHVIPSVLRAIDWPNTAILAHNTAFDGYILTQHYHTPQPKLWLDTLSMARPVMGVNARLSLKALAEYFHLPPKGEELINSRGIRDLSPAQYASLAPYCIHDTELCWAIFQRLIQGFPGQELRVIDLTLRMFLDPYLRLDTKMLEEYLVQVQNEKADMLALSGLDSRDALMSNDQFAVLLEALGVEPPLKISKTTGLPTYAFAKSDPAFKALLEDDDERVANLVAARIGVKSTIEETRTGRFLQVARDNRPWPVALNYYGARTTGRHSGGNKQNAQNLRRGGVLRRSVKAPPKRKVVVADSAQIEARVLATVAGQTDLVQAFREKRDIYSDMATDIYGRPINRKRVEVVNGVEVHPDKLEGQVGKTSILGLGYGMGDQKFQFTLKIGNPPVEIEIGQCSHVVSIYRNKFPKIPELWRTMGHAIECVYQGIERDFGYFTTCGEGLRLAPNGFLIRYPGLKPDGRGSWIYTQKGKPSKLYGAKATENLVQALARIAVTDQMVEVMREEHVRKYGHHLVLFTHDELVMVAPDETAQDVLNLTLEKMHTPPTWMPDLPIAAEGGIADRYGDAK